MEFKSTGSANELYKKLKTKFQEYQAAGKMSQVSKIDFNDSANTAVASGTGYKAIIECKDNVVSIDLDLSFLLRPMKGKIEEGIGNMISKALA